MANNSAPLAVMLRDVRFRWPLRKVGDDTLDIPLLDIRQGERVFIAGPSGSGKTTFLNLICGIHAPNTGEIQILGQPLHAMNNALRDRFRCDHFGVIFQQFNLLPYLSALENVMLPCRLSSRRKLNVERSGSTMADDAVRLLNALRLPESTHRNAVHHLSMGQQQRAAAARAFIGTPELVIADEPTSALDTEHQQAFINLLFEQCERTGATLIFVSHNQELTCLFDRVISMVSLQRQSGASNA